MYKFQTVIFLFLLCGGLLFARKFPLAASAVVPAARGHVDVGHDHNGNTQVKLDVEFLAPPNSLSPPAATYVVWLQPRDGSPEAEGQLKVGNDRKAHFETVTSEKNFELFITAEKDPAPEAPTGPPVLQATIQP